METCLRISRREFQHHFNLLSLDAGEPFKKIVNSRATFEILEHGAHGNACILKYPLATDLFSITFNDGAIFPVGA